MENQSARRTSAARTIEAKKPQSPVIPNAAFFIVASNLSQYQPHALAIAPQPRESENHPIKNRFEQF